MEPSQPIPAREVERMTKLQDVLLKATAKQVTSYGPKTRSSPTSRQRMGTAAFQAVEVRCCIARRRAILAKRNSHSWISGIRTEQNGDELLLKVRDNGPGIDGLPLEDIWLPGQSTTPGGTGLGLTIVKDAVTELGGAVEAQARGALGWAEFVVTLPLLKEK